MTVEATAEKAPGTRGQSSRVNDGDPARETVVCVSPSAVMMPMATSSTTTLMSGGGGEMAGGMGGGGCGGGGDGGRGETKISTCGISLSSLFWNKHSVYVPASRESVIFRSVRTTSAVPSGYGASLQAAPLVTNEATSVGKMSKSPVNYTSVGEFAIMCTCSMPLIVTDGGG